MLVGGDNSIPLVSVLIVTFNHRQYIAQSIESALIQQTDFPYEIVVGEDCSTDGTREILLRYQKRNPDKIRLLLHARNIGASANFLFTFAQCRGRYVAILEGDDYWTSSVKLRRQTVLLESNPKASFCFSKADEVRELHSGENKFIRQRKPQIIKEFYGPEDAIMIPSEISHASTLLLRNGIVDYPDWFPNVANGDTIIAGLYLRKGPAVFLNESTSVYRVHGKGMYTSMTSIVATAESLRTMNKLFELEPLVFSYVIGKFIVPNIATIVFLSLRAPRNFVYILRRPSVLNLCAKYTARYPLLVVKGIVNDFRIRWSLRKKFSKKQSPLGRAFAGESIEHPK